MAYAKCDESLAFRIEIELLILASSEPFKTNSLVKDIRYEFTDICFLPFQLPNYSFPRIILIKAPNCGNTNKYPVEYLICIIYIHNCIT